MNVCWFALGIAVEILFAPIGKKIATESPPERPKNKIENLYNRVLIL